MKDMHYASATELTTLLKDKSISAEELTKLHLQRIAQVNPQLNAVVELNEAALTEAKQADKNLANGQAVGALHGLPITIKDSFMVKGMKCTSGTEAWKNHVAQEDAFCVARLRDAGAIILGTTNVPEILMAFESDNNIYGKTSNPYDLSKTAGGSSGGEASIIAAGGSPAGLGSDGGGSIRVPAHFTGIAGIKPTQGLLSRRGIQLPMRGLGLISPIGTAGPMARFVDDLGLMLSVLAGYDFLDPHSLPYANQHKPDLSKLRVAFYTDNGLATPNEEIQIVVKDAADALAKNGMKVKEEQPDTVKSAYELLWKHYFQDGDGNALHREILTNLGTQNISPLHEEFFALAKQNNKTTTEWLLALKKIAEYKAEMQLFMRNFDVIICPPCATTAKKHHTTMKEIKDFSYTMAYNLTGWPGAVVRCGTDKHGMPIGVQVIARPWHDDVAIAVAKILETELGGWQAPKL